MMSIDFKYGLQKQEIAKRKHDEAQDQWKEREEERRFNQMREASESLLTGGSALVWPYYSDDVAGRFLVGRRSVHV
jgi:hypothetical protein